MNEFMEKRVFVFVGILILLGLVAAASEGEWKTFTKGDEIDFCAQADRTCNANSCLYCVSYDEGDDCYNSLSFSQCDGSPDDGSGIEDDSDDEDDRDDEDDDDRDDDNPTVNFGVNKQVNNNVTNVEKKDLGPESGDSGVSNVLLIVGMSGFTFLALGLLIGLLFYAKAKKDFGKK